MPSQIDHVVVAAAEDVFLGRSIGYRTLGDTMWIDERATLGVPLALTSAQ